PSKRTEVSHRGVAGRSGIVDSVSKPNVGISAWLLTRLMSPVDAAGAVVFRISFGLIAAWWALDDLWTGRVTSLYVAPKIHFSYAVFDWVRPWPGVGPYLHFAVLHLLALCIAVGLVYRWATVGFALGFTIFFLWDRTNYQNHYYLLLLLSWLLV